MRRQNSSKFPRVFEQPGLPSADDSILIDNDDDSKPDIVRLPTVPPAPKRKSDDPWDQWTPFWGREPIVPQPSRLKNFALMLRRLILLHATATRFAIPMLVVYWSIIFYGTHTPHLHVPMPSISDKVMHFTAFCGLAMLLCFSIRSRTFTLNRRLAYAGIGCAVYGIFDELTQLLVKNRSADPWDYLADCLGMLTGLAIYACLRHLMRITSDRYRASEMNERAA